MSVAFERLVQHFEEHNFSYRVDDDREVLRANFRGEVGNRQLVAVVEEEEGLFQVFGCIDVGVPEGARAAVAETLTRVNYGLRVGKFEFDFRDGEVRFQASSVLLAGMLDDFVIRQLIGTTLALLDRYMPAVLSVVYANESPIDAVARVEAEFAGSRAE